MGPQTQGKPHGEGGFSRLQGDAVMKGKNQKLKLLYLAKIMQEQTDDTHALSMSEILAELAKHEILAQRKSFYEDLAALDEYVAQASPIFHSSCEGKLGIALE